MPVALSTLSWLPRNLTWAPIRTRPGLATGYKTSQLGPDWVVTSSQQPRPQQRFSHSNQSECFNYDQLSCTETRTKTPATQQQIKQRTASCCHISKWCLVPGSLINPLPSTRSRTFTNYVISHIIPRCSTHQDRRVKIIMDYWSWRGGVVVRVGWLNLEMYISTLTTDWPRPHSSTTDFSTVWLRW